MRGQRLDSRHLLGVKWVTGAQFHRALGGKCPLSLPKDLGYEYECMENSCNKLLKALCGVVSTCRFYIFP